MSQNLVQIQQAEILQAVNRAEVDIQIATAKQYKRNRAEALANIAEIALGDDDTVISLFYRLRRKDKSTGEEKIISGGSVRLAEIIAACWGNLRIQCRQIGNDGKTITVQAMAHDLESNFAHSLDVKRSIVTKDGKTFSQDMQTVTANAAAAIAFRNAVFKVVPLAVINPLINEIRSKAENVMKNLDKRKEKMLAYFASLNVSQKDILKYLGEESFDKVNNATIIELLALAQEIREGRISVDEVFFPDRQRGRSSNDMANQATSAMRRSSQRQQQQPTDQQPQPQQPQTLQEPQQ